MSVTRAIAATAMLAGLAIGGAAPAWADPFSGHYTATETSTGGAVVTQSLDVTPCGDGCAKISYEGGAPWTAHLLNGQQWVWDETDDYVVCDDGTKVPNAFDAHKAIDAATLRGTAVVTWKKATCGIDNTGNTLTHTLVLTPSSSGQGH
jgi:hypothetical protein